MKILVACCTLLIASAGAASAHDPICMASFTIENPGGPDASRVSILGWDSKENNYMINILNTNTRAIVEFMAVLRAYGVPRNSGRHSFTKKAPVIAIDLDRENGFQDGMQTNGKHLYMGNIIDLSDGDDLCPIAEHPHAQ